MPSGILLTSSGLGWVSMACADSTGKSDAFRRMPRRRPSASTVGQPAAGGLSVPSVARTMSVRGLSIS
ncbi:hypothetical protein OH76DRAFT_1412459 [Lentinus brumalis]|uniref:Uncharacterized protein n=1 Tax=Lentinus brumalis TaxID=2498619 RepID=A0A371CL97_9APHY|nr:hypothetical protein OH76DRAFT_1412459 [Polyporus brumalis]